eukprot:gene3935-4556_t
MADVIHSTIRSYASKSLSPLSSDNTQDQVSSGGGISSSTFSLPTPSSSQLPSPRDSLPPMVSSNIFNQLQILDGPSKKLKEILPSNNSSSQQLPSIIIPSSQPSKSFISSFLYDLNHSHEYSIETGDFDGNPEQYYCKYCDKTWPSSFFRNKQSFGAHCSNCSRKRKHRDDGYPFVPEINNEKRQRRGAEDSSDFEDSDIWSYQEDTHRIPSSSPYSPVMGPYSSPPHSPLMGIGGDGLRFGLLDVIEDKIAEENEIEFMKKDLKNLESEIVIQDMKREKDIQELKASLSKDIKETESRVMEDINEKDTDDDKLCNKMKEELLNEYNLLEKELNEQIELLKAKQQQTQSITATEDNGIATSAKPVSDKLESNEEINRLLNNLKSCMSGKISHLGLTLITQGRELERLVSLESKECEKHVNKKFEEVSRELTEFTEGLSSSFAMIETLLNNQ